MGTGKKKTSKIRGFEENIELLTNTYSCINGFFGIKGKGRSFTRNIISEDSVKEALNFFHLAGDGGVITPLNNGKGFMSRLNDGTIISYRRVSSSDGTSVVEINIKQSSNITTIKSQKIHFVEEQK